MKSIWHTRTIEAAVPDVNVNARPRKVVEHFRQFLEEVPITVVDVGTRGGIPGELEPLVRHIHLVAIEPDPHEAARLKEIVGGLGLRSVVVLAMAAGPAGGEFTLNITREPGKSSLFEPNWEVLQRYAQERDYEVTRRQPVRTRSLGQILAEQGIHEVDFLKLDVQGFELEVLKTLSEEQCRHLLLIETEVEFVELYSGQPLFRHIDEHLSASGFEMFNLIRVFANYHGGRWAPYGRGQLQFGEAYYLRTRLELLSVRQIAKLIFLSAFYGFNDYGYFQFLRHEAPLRELGDHPFRLFREYFASFAAPRPGVKRMVTTGLRLVLDRVLFLYLTRRRWNGLKTDTDRAYPFR